jgi:hypothetical protein
MIPFPKCAALFLRAKIIVIERDGKVKEGRKLRGRPTA